MGRPSKFGSVVSYIALLGIQLTSVTSAVAATLPADAAAERKAFSPLSAQIDPQVLFAAIDAGDAARVKAHLDFVQSMNSINMTQTPVQLNLEFRDAAGNTPLIRAAALPNLDVVRYLRMQGAALNAENAQWETPLIVAYNSGNLNNAKYLLSAGAADPYNVAERVRQLEAQQVAAAEEKEESINASKTVIYVAGAAAGAGAIIGGAAAFGGSGSSKGSTPGGNTGNSATIDCGSGVGIHPEACSASSFQTTEATAQEGFLAMNTQYAFAHGYDGSIYNRNGSGALLDDAADGRVLVGVLDTGIDLTHPDLDSNLRTDLAVTCTTSGCSAGGTDVQGHGTKVAGIIAAERNGTGMHGIAPKAQVIPIAAISVSSGSDVAAFRYANDNAAQVVNASYGYIYSSSDTETVPIIDATGPVIPGGTHASGGYSAYTPSDVRDLITATEAGTTLLTQFQRANTDGRIIVFAAGNSGLDQSGILAGLPFYFQGATAPSQVSQSNYDVVNPTHEDWSDIWVSVVSLNDSNTISSFSNKCGVAKNWCLAAPGEIASTTKNGGGYESGNGTSFAAPNVTGAIAVMLGAFPQLTPQRVLEILFDTATDIGTAGVDDIYGHGLVNLQKATDPTVGSWTLSVHGTSGSSSSSSSSFAFGTSGFGLAAPFGNALSQNNSRLMFQDGYGKDYAIPLSFVSSSLTPQKTAFDTFMEFADNTYDAVVQMGKNTQFSFTQAAIDKTNVHGNAMPFEHFAYQTQIESGKDTIALGLHYKTNTADAMIDDKDRRAMVSEAYNDPYLNLMDSTNSSSIGYQSGHSRYMVAGYYGRADREYSYRFDNTKNVTGMYSEYRYSDASAGAEVSVSNGVMMEENSMLGSETSGAFGIDQSTTYHAGIKGRFLLAKDVMLLANYHMGMTQVNAASDSIFTGFDSLMTNSFAAGIEMSGVHSEEDRLGFSVSQPLRVTSGRADLTLPVDVASDSSIIYGRDSLNLAPKGRQLDFETYYHIPFDQASELHLNAIYRLNPNNGAFETNDATLLTKYHMAF